MSGALKTVGKVFKSVTKSTVGKVAVAAAAAYFTAGLGSTILGATGLSASMSPVLGTVLSNAISGAAAGTLTSALTGQGIGKGALIGAGTGAVVGGIRAGFGDPTPGEWAPPSKTSDAVQQTGVNPGKNIITGNAPPPAGSAELGQTGPLEQGVVNNTLRTDSIGATHAGPGGQNIAITLASEPKTTGMLGVGNALDPNKKAAVNPGFFAKEGWLDRNQTLAGGAAAGAGTGLLAMAGARGAAAAAKARSEAEIEAERNRAARIAASHDNSGLLTVSDNQLSTTRRPTPQQKYDRPQYRGEWIYDQQQNKIVFVAAA